MVNSPTILASVAKAFRVLVFVAIAVVTIRTAIVVDVSFDRLRAVADGSGLALVNVLGGLGFGLALVSFLVGSVGTRLEARGREAKLELEELDEQGQRKVLGEVRARVQDEIKAKAEASVILDELLRGALLVRASDMHVNPGTAEAAVTYRIHGALHEVVEFPGEVRSRIAQRLKVLASIDPYARDARDGKLRRTISGLTFEARVSVLPAELGDRLVLRFVSNVDDIPNLASIGFEPNVVSALEGILSRGQGMLFVSGPVGSGKTTTLYSSLAFIHEKRGSTTSLVTLEDPIERRLPFATQSQIDARHGRGFAATLRSVLRQDPNVLMVGEIRDEETARIATQAGLTGHLILTTLHVESAAGTFARLFDMGVAPFVATNATAGCLSQRLLRVLCDACKQPIEPDSRERALLERHGFDPRGTFFAPLGCAVCEGQGYVGRTPIAELMVVTPEIREAVLEKRPSHEIAELARAAGMTSLLEGGLRKAASGSCALREVVEVIS